MAPRYPAIPEPTTDPASLRDSVLSIKQAFETLTGQRGNSNYAALTGDSSVLADVTTNTADIATNTAAIAALPAAASQSDQETATDTSKPVTPGRQKFHPSAAKAWVKFAGSAVNGAQTISASYNVSSVSRTSAGIYAASFTTAFSSANYAATISGTAAAVLITQLGNGTQATGSIGLVFSNTAGAQIDPVSGYLVVFGDQ